MVVKEALLQSERELIVAFLKEFGLKYENDITNTLYITVGDSIIGTISRSKAIIKCLAIAKDYQGENIASKLVNEMINSLANEKIYNYKVYTKKIYLDLFISLNFRLLTCTDNICFLEGGILTIFDKLKSMKTQIELNLNTCLNGNDIGAVVVNCNPPTNGHLALIEYIAAKHNYVIVFLLEEDASLFSFQERMALLYIATRHLKNVTVIQSSEYIISKETFPSYFLKNEEDKNIENAYIDGLIFKNYFMEYFNISKRYVGSETTLFMQQYNMILKELLKEKLEIIDRYKYQDVVISASKVRKLISDSKIEDAVNYIPKAAYTLFKQIAKSKQN